MLLYMQTNVISMDPEVSGFRMKFFGTSTTAYAFTRYDFLRGHYGKDASTLKRAKALTVTVCCLLKPHPE